MFANYPLRTEARSLGLKFENVETQQPSDLALLGDMLNDIRQRATALITERQRLLDVQQRLQEDIHALQNQLTDQRTQIEERDMRLEGLEAKVAEQQSELTSLRSTPEPQPQPVPSADPIVGERIRALVEEIDACIALMPHTRDMAATELLSA
tara:strand:- start:634 stop:1092 length:459 start_codon:yes stop_codon:yes gene_type:complete